MPISLHKDLASSGWHSSIITTYSVDPVFYDLYVERRLRTYGCENNILMADARMLKRALDSTPEAFRAAGSRYAVLPVKVPGAFHPKVHLRLGSEKARLVAGSANATAAGWGRNQEVVSTLEWRVNADNAPDNDAIGALVARAYTYLVRWLASAPGEVMQYKLQFLRRKCPWLQDLQPPEDTIELQDGTAIDLLCESSGDSPSILRQFTGLAMKDEVRRLIVVSPYWDANLRGLRDLRRALGMPPTVVTMNPKSSTFPLSALAKNDALKFVEFDGTDAERFLHAKIFIVETRQADHILFGSANCSDDALGLMSGPARNAEASIYRRLPSRTVLASLGIDLRRTLSREAISIPVRLPPGQEAGPPAISAGEMELLGRTLTWWPPSGVDCSGATIRIRAVEVLPKKVSSAKWVAELPEPPVFPVIARVAYRDGHLSDPVIVHGQARLRRAAPADINAALSDALSKARRGEGDLLELALQAHIIFAPDSRDETKATSGRVGKRQDKPDKAVQYATPEEFRQAVSMRAATGNSGLFAHDDPGLQEVLSIVLHGINANKAIEPDDEIAEIDDRDLLAGDTEDDETDPEDSPDNTNESQTSAPPQPPNTKREFTSEEVISRRRQMLKALDKFDGLLKDLAADPSKISSRIAGQTMFVFWLMRYGHRFVHRGVASGPKRLLVLAPATTAERDYSFVIRAMWILMAIWRGAHAIAPLIKVDSRHGELQDDLFGLVVHSRWALARAYLATAQQGDMTLALRIKAAALDIYPATQRLGPVDAAAEERTMAQLDGDFGCSASQTEELLHCCREFDSAAKLKMSPVSPQAAQTPSTAAQRAKKR